MKKIFIALFCIAALAFTCGCGSSKDTIEVTAYEWKVTLKNGDYATGVAQTESEAKSKVKAFADNRRGTIKHQSVKPVKKRMKKSTFQ